MTRILFALRCLAASLLLPASGAFAAPVVHTSDGAVSGIAKPGLRVFLGIPYARPPVGDLRWRAPQPVVPWHDVRAATQFAPSCHQSDPKPFGPYTASFIIPPDRSEDCLYLNVWAPDGGSGKRPVYFFIHGGGFQSGGASVPAYDGADLARKGAVVVTINYRLGIFGFFAHPELTRESPIGSSGNYGVLDAIAALHWVHDNIARFGGDPADVTIAGQSAGAIMVDDLLLSPLAKDLFQRAVSESGPMLGLPIPTLAQAEKAGLAATAKLDGDGIAALRALSAADLAKRPPTGIPWLNLDGKVIAADPDQPDAHVASKVPVIAGYNRDESTADAPKTVAAFEKAVRGRYGALAERFLALYPHADDAEAARSGAQIARDRHTAALLFWAERRSAQGQPVYAYSFEHTFPGSDPARYGAFHSSEVPYIFGTLDLKDAGFTAEDRRISDMMQDRWLAFMRTGDPNPPHATLRWSRASADPKSVWRIGATDFGPLIGADRLALFRDFVAQGGKLGLF